MSGGSDIPITPNQDRGESSQKSKRRPDIPSGDISPSKKQRPDDQPERNQPDPNIIICNLLLSPKEYRYTSRVLTPAEVDPTNPVLLISNDYEHFVFLNNHILVDNPRFTGWMPYSVYDKYKKHYNMMLSRTESMQVSLSGWSSLVRGCGLRAGDEVGFCRYLDTRISHDFVYILKNNNEALDVLELSTSSTTMPVIRIIYPRLQLVKIPGQGPGSRDFPQESHCMSKPLTFLSMVPGGALILSVTETIILTDNPRFLELPKGRNYEKNIQVFDEENHKYTMTVKALYSQRREVFSFYLSGGQWTNFVKRHNLEEGDEIMIYKCLDSTVSSRYYHVFRYVSKKAVDVVPLKNDSVSATAGKTQSADDASDQKRDVPEGSGSRSLSC